MRLTRITMILLINRPAIAATSHGLYIHAVSKSGTAR